MSNRLVKTALVASCLSARAMAQPEGPQDVPSVGLVRTEVAPVIDGLLDDLVWANATLIDGFRQVEPVEGGVPSQQTTVRVLFDRDAIYFGIRCDDTDAESIVAKQLRRDGDLESDDRVELVIDPWFDRRNGYYFAVNPLGARRDALVVNNTDLLDDWDGIWYAKATIDDGGWSAEIKLPFKTISFAPGETRWSFNVERTVRRDNELSRWASPQRNKPIQSIADAGVLEGISEIDQGVGLDVIPYVRLGFTHDEATGDDFDADAGVDLFYKLTPSMTLAITINTDFAETEVDERRVNLTRFPLFFPEKRDFFLQDAGIFEFGGIRFNPLPFQSRRIGLDSQGQPIPILLGTKITGRAGPWSLGFLNVFTDDGATVDAKNLTVARASLDVLEESTLGFITTIGDPQINEDNAVVGADFNFRDSTTLDGQVLEGHAFFMESFSSGDGNDYSWGMKLGYPNDTIDWQFSYTEIGDQFRAALGFVPRRGIREYFGQWRYRWRPGTGWLRTIDSGIRSFVVTDLDNHLETSDITLELVTLRSAPGDELGLTLEFNREVLTEDFEIQPGNVIPTGNYSFTRLGAEAETSSAYPLAISAGVEIGEFFDGHRLDTVVGGAWRPSPHVFLSFDWERNDVHLPGGDFVVNIVSSRVDFLLTPDISWTNFIQWDDVADSLGWNSRLRWIVEPGSEMFFVVNQAFDTFDARWEPTTTEVVTKLGWTFRF